MKDKDWFKGIFHPLPVLVQCFQKHSHKPVGVEFKIRASSKDEADTQVSQILSQHHGNFLRKTQGNFDTKYVHLKKEH